MKKFIDRLKEIETIVELSIGEKMTEKKATDIYSITNDLMTEVKKLNKTLVIKSLPTDAEIVDWAVEVSEANDKSSETRKQTTKLVALAMTLMRNDIRDNSVGNVL